MKDLLMKGKMMQKEQPEALQLPTVPFAVFDEFGQPCEDRVRDHFAAAFEALRAQIGQGVPHDAGQQINHLVSAVFRKGELWERCQGKGWPEAESDEFTKLRDETIPDAIAQLQRALASAPPVPQQKPLTDEQIKDCLDAADQMYCSRDGDKEIFKARAIESAATEPLLQRIEELEEMNAQLREQNTEVDKACAEFERQLEEARKDAERWKMTIEISQDVLRHPDSRKIPASVSAYMNAIHEGYDMTYAVDAAIDAVMQNNKPVGVVFQKGQS